MSGKKVLVTGHKGMLGSSLIKNLGFKNIVGFEIDITDSDCVKIKISEENPDIVIHCAAYTNVDECEVNKDKAYAINAVGSQNLVNHCIDKDILFIYISSTGVYGEYKEGAYTEFDSTKPKSVHHKSKREGEKSVERHLSKYLILRTGWLFSDNLMQSKNFIQKIYLDAKNKNFLYSDDIQIGNPTYVLDLVKQIKILIKTKQYGIFNCVNEAENVSRYNYVNEIVKKFKLDCTVSIAPVGMFNRKAPVSTNESAINYKLNLLNINTMRTWDMALSACIENVKKL